MKTIKIFLASSSELKEDRNAFAQFLYTKTISWKDKGVFLEIVQWEEFLDAVSQTRLQDEYNKAIVTCDIFVLLFFTKVGKYTDEEFETAFNQFKQTGKPYIYTYFKDAEITTGNAKKEDLNTLWNFQEKLNKLGHFYTTYKSSEDLLLKFGSQLDKLAANEFIQAEAVRTSEKPPVINYHTYLSQLQTLTASNEDLNRKVQELADHLSKYENEKKSNRTELDENIGNNYINDALKEIISKLPDETTINKKVKWKIASVVIVCLLAIAFIIFLNTYNATTSVTVFVHGKAGRQDMVLRQKGDIIMDVSGERKHESIDENGKAVFQNVKVGERVSLDVDFSEPYHPVKRDSIYKIKKDDNIYLEVMLPLDTVFGKVFYQDHALDSVIVSIGRLKDTTDMFGNYGIKIPETLQKQMQEVTFYKPGFKTLVQNVYPQTGESVKVIMEK